MSSVVEQALDYFEAAHALSATMGDEAGPQALPEKEFEQHFHRQSSAVKAMTQQSAASWADLRAKARVAMQELGELSTGDRYRRQAAMLYRSIFEDIERPAAEIGDDIPPR